jgi:hypothetical protein
MPCNNVQQHNHVMLSIFNQNLITLMFSPPVEQKDFFERQQYSRLKMHFLMARFRSAFRASIVKCTDATVQIWQKYLRSELVSEFMRIRPNNQNSILGSGY